MSLSGFFTNQSDRYYDSPDEPEELECPCVVCGAEEGTIQLCDGVEICPDCLEAGTQVPDEFEEVAA